MKNKFYLLLLVLIFVVTSAFGQKGVKREHPAHYGMDIAEFVAWHKAPESILEFKFGPNMDKMTIHILEIKNRLKFYSFKNNKLDYWGHLEEYAQSDKRDLVALAGEIRPRMAELLDDKAQKKLFKKFSDIDLLYPGFTPAQVADIIDREEKLSGELSILNGATETEYSYRVYVAKRNTYGVPYLIVFENDALKYWGYFEDFNKSFDLTKNRINHELRSDVYDIIVEELMSRN